MLLGKHTGRQKLFASFTNGSGHVTGLSKRRGNETLTVRHSQASHAQTDTVPRVAFRAPAWCENTSSEPQHDGNESWCLLMLHGQKADFYNIQAVPHSWIVLSRRLRI